MYYRFLRTFHLNIKLGHASDFGLLVLVLINGKIVSKLFYLTLDKTNTERFIKKLWLQRKLVLDRDLCIYFTNVNVVISLTTYFWFLYGWFNVVQKDTHTFFFSRARDFPLPGFLQSAVCLKIIL